MSALGEAMKQCNPTPHSLSTSLDVQSSPSLSIPTSSSIVLSLIHPFSPSLAPLMATTPESRCRGCSCHLISRFASRRPKYYVPSPGRNNSDNPEPKMNALSGSAGIPRIEMGPDCRSRGVTAWTSPHTEDASFGRARLLTCCGSRWCCQPGCAADLKLDGRSQCGTQHS